MDGVASDQELFSAGRHAGFLGGGAAAASSSAVRP